MSIISTAIEEALSEPGHNPKETLQSVPNNRKAPVAQLDRVLPSEGRGHRFESCRARHFLRLTARK
jgi:hypothetical protein